MADIFLSYAQKDRKRAEQVADALRDSGWQVWWDANLYAGTRFRAEIAKQLHAAKCVVALWSAVSIESDWVIDEAEDGKQRGVLVQAIIDPVQPPHGFRQIQYANLVGWKGLADDEGFRNLLGGVDQKAPRKGIAAPVRTVKRATEVAPTYRGRFSFARLAQYLDSGAIQVQWKVLPTALAVEVTNISTDSMQQVQVIVERLRLWNPFTAMFEETLWTASLPISLPGPEELPGGEPALYTFNRAHRDATAVEIVGLAVPNRERAKVRLLQIGRWRLDLTIKWKGGDTQQQLEFDFSGEGVPVPIDKETDSL